jgi:hypothetical protein
MVQASDINLDLILDECARELVYEETRWNTLLRPQTVIDTNKDVVLEQHPGW